MLLCNSLSELVRWLGAKAEELGVEIYPGFAASEVWTSKTHDAGILVFQANCLLALSHHWEAVVCCTSLIVESLNVINCIVNT